MRDLSVLNLLVIFYMLYINFKFSFGSLKISRFDFLPGRKAIGTSLGITKASSDTMCVLKCSRFAECEALNYVKEEGIFVCELIGSVTSWLFDLEDSDAYIDKEKYHIQRGFVLVEGDWLIMTDAVSTMQVGEQFCVDHFAVPYVPMSPAGHKFFVDEATRLGIGWVWYLISDVKVEGNFKYRDGTPVTEDSSIPWEHNTYLTSNTEDRDCAQMSTSVGVRVVGCTIDDSNFVCKSILN